MSNPPIDKALFVKPYKSLRHSLRSSFIHCEALETERETQIKTKAIVGNGMRNNYLNWTNFVSIVLTLLWVSANGFNKGASRLDIPTTTTTPQKNKNKTEISTDGLNTKHVSYLPHETNPKRLLIGVIVVILCPHTCVSTPKPIFANIHQSRSQESE